MPKTHISRSIGDQITTMAVSSPSQNVYLNDNASDYEKRVNRHIILVAGFCRQHNTINDICSVILKYFGAPLSVRWSVLGYPQTDRLKIQNTAIIFPIDTSDSTFDYTMDVQCNAQCANNYNKTPFLVFSIFGINNQIYGNN